MSKNFAVIGDVGAWVGLSLRTPEKMRSSVVSGKDVPAAEARG
ncbi:hypothetical protein GGE45_003405 [Rhizobium aethiopicum]|uniref:Uncharacterized protein n=1 Tax=Rhizobium aethiopicum TaxID=1138170 RepID=A0A7W6MJ05_9HYPH|nr:MULTISPECIES: hypothetical protein [Rhizobium]MBB4193641.1 hypothetical protein [Rhizobium aethiopicum]MBB4581065.1 hypothetical protein [Rhizobium aethiopicum]MDO3433447.1 hypothetical protein [Rhizobium sp. CBN3]